MVNSAHLQAFDLHVQEAERARGKRGMMGLVRMMDRNTEIVMVGMTCAYFFMIMLESLPRLSDASPGWLVGQVAFNLVFFVDLLIRFQRADSPKSFVLNPFNLIEIGSLICFLYEFGADIHRHTTYSLEDTGFTAYSVSKSLRTYRLVHPLTLLDLGSKQIEMFRDVVFKCKPVFMIMTLLTFTFMCVVAPLTYLVERMADEPYDVPFSSIPAAMWYFVNIITTVGFGDMAPATYTGKFICCWVIVINCITMLLPLSILTVICVEDSRSVSKDEGEDNPTTSQKGSEGEIIVFDPTVDRSPYTWAAQERQYLYRLLNYDDEAHSRFTSFTRHIVFVLVLTCVGLEIASTQVDLTSKDVDRIDATNTVLLSFLVLEYICRAVSTPRPLAQHLLSPINLVDLIAILASTSSRIYPETEAFRSTKVLFRGLRLWQGFKTIGYTRTPEKLWTKTKTTSLLPSLLALVALFVVFDIIGGVWIFEFDRGTFDHSSGNYVDAQGEVSAFQSIFDGLWWASQTMTTVGYGDTVPTSIRGKIMSSLFQIVSSITLTMPIAILGAHYCVAYEKLKADNNHERRRMLIMNLEEPENRHTLKTRLQHFERDMNKLSEYFHKKYPFALGPQREGSKRDIIVKRGENDPPLVFPTTPRTEATASERVFTDTSARDDELDGDQPIGLFPDL